MPPRRPRWQRFSRAIWALPIILAALAMVLACAGRRHGETIRPKIDPHALKRRGADELRSASLGISLRYHEGDARKLPFALIRLTNRTRAPIYPRLKEITIGVSGQEARPLPLACDRDRSAFARLAPERALWCGDVANPGFSIDLPVALFEIPAAREALRFDLAIPVVFGRGDPVEVRFANRVTQARWALELSAAAERKSNP